MANVLVEKQSLIDLADMLREKTGTSDPIKPEDFAAVAESIPSGPQPTPTPVDPEDPTDVQYGAVLYYKNTREGQYPTNISGGTLNGIDQDVLANFLEAYPGQQGATYFMYESYEGKWYWGTSASQQGYIYIPDNMFKQMTGIDFTRREGGDEMGMMEDRPQISITPAIVPADDVTEWAICADQSEVDQLCESMFQDKTYSIGGETVHRCCIKRFVFGSVPTSIPSQFLTESSVRTISPIPANITSIGYQALSYSPLFNSPIVLPATLQTVAERCFMSNPSFNSTITFPENGQIVFGDLAFSYLSSFNQPLVLRGIADAGTCFFESCSSFNSNINFTDSVQTLGRQVFWYCPSMTATVTAGIPASRFEHSQSQWDANGPFYGNSNTPSETEGVKLTGPYAQDWVDDFGAGGEYQGRKFIIV